MKRSEFLRKYNVFEFAAASEAMFERAAEGMNGYKRKTTFFADFSIADYLLGVEPDAIEQTYKNAFKSWRKDFEMWAEIVLVLNHKSWFWYENDEQDLSMKYSDLYLQAKDVFWEEHGENQKAVDYWFEWID